MEYLETGINPVKEYREDRDLSVKKFAKFVGVSYNTIHRVEEGYPATLPTRIKNTLNEIDDGLGDDLAKKYAEWRKREREKILSSQSSD